MAIVITKGEGRTNRGPFKLFSTTPKSTQVQKLKAILDDNEACKRYFALSFVLHDQGEGALS